MFDRIYESLLNFRYWVARNFTVSEVSIIVINFLILLTLNIAVGMVS